MGVALRAGAAAGVITPHEPVAMAGYARRSGSAEGTLDDLMCRVIVLDDGSDRLVLAVCDLLYATVALTAAVRRKVGDRLGIPPQHVMLTATHTHSGPGRLAAADDPFLDELSDRVTAVVADACARLAPARLVVGRTPLDGIGLNRRRPDGPRVREARVLLALPLDGAASPIATLVAYACHATILEHDNRSWSADFPGAACRRIEAALGGTALYLQGCAGNINPVYADHTWGECQRVGGIVGAATTRAALELMALAPGLRSINLSWGEEVPVSPVIVGRVVDPTKLRALSVSVSVEARDHRSPAAIAAEAATVQARLAQAADPDERRELLPRVSELWVEELLAAGDELVDSIDVPRAEAAQVEVQGFLLGRDLALVGLPGEPFVETGMAIQADQDLDVLVSGYANGAAGYLPTRAAFTERGYEVGCSLYAPGTAEMIAATARRVTGVLASESAGDE